MPKLVSMKRAKDDARGDKTMPAPVEAIAPDYPYGLCLHLEDEELKKLGIDKLPDVGAEMTMTATVRVTRVSESEDERVPSTGKERCVNLQITAASIE